jgi:hypothetical protein
MLRVLATATASAVVAFMIAACSSSDAATAPDGTDGGTSGSSVGGSDDAGGAVGTGPGAAKDAGAAHDGGQADTGAAMSKTYRLPWSSTTTMQLTQDCNDSCCSDHVGNDAYAWDWANGTGFVVKAARAGTITHLKLSSTTGCATSACSTDVNMIVIDHGDGTQATYMHLQGSSAKPGITCGAAVTQGQDLAIAGTTGHSTGLHLHFQVNGVHAGAPTCECGKDGLGCADTYNPFPDVWVTATDPAQAVTFEDWPTSSKCADRRITMPKSLN